MAGAAALFSAPLSPHITEISPQTFPSLALLPLHITSADPLSLDPSASATLHLQSRGATSVHVQALSKNAFFSKYFPPLTAFFSLRCVSRLTTGHELSMRLTSHTGWKGCIHCAQLWASLLLLRLERILVRKKQVHWVRFFFLKQKFLSEQRSKDVVMTRYCVRSAQTTFKIRFYEVSPGSSCLKVTIWKNKRKTQVHANHSTFHQECTCSRATCPSHSESSQQLQRKQLTEDMERETGWGGWSLQYSQGNDGKGA